MGLKQGESFPWVSDLFFTSTRPTFDSAALWIYGESRTFSFYYPKGCPEDHRASRIATSSSPARTRCSRTGTAWSPEEYEANKKRMVDETIADIDRRVPGTGAKIEHAEASHHSPSASIPKRRVARHSARSSRGCRTRWSLSEQVEGLYHAGSSVGIIMSGWLGAANYGAITANKVDARLAAMAKTSRPRGGAARERDRRTRRDASSSDRPAGSRRASRGDHGPARG